MKLRAWIPILASFVANPTTAQVIFIDPCGIEMPLLQPSQLQIWVCVEGEISGGITTADFRIAGLPAGWQTSLEMAPGNVITGDPFGAGATVVLPGCQAGMASYLPLFTATVTPTVMATDVVLMIAARTPTPDPPFDCSFVTLCDAPSATKVCVLDHGTIVNPRTLGCGLPVAATTWTQVKALYD